MRSRSLRHLLTTSLLQVVNRLVASCLSKFVIHKLVLTSCYKSANYKLQTLCNLNKLASLLQVVDKLQQAEQVTTRRYTYNIENLQQVCRVFGCVDNFTVKGYLIHGLLPPRYKNNQW